MIQSFVQMANASVQVRQGESQASAREGEVNATIGQSQKQKVEDQMSFDAGFMKDVLQLIQQYTQSHNQACVRRPEWSEPSPRGRKRPQRCGFFLKRKVSQ